MSHWFRCWTFMQVSALCEWAIGLGNVMSAMWPRYSGVTTTDGVTPIFPEKTGDLFSHHRLSAVSSAVSPLFIFSWKTDFWSSLSLLFISLGCHQAPFYLSNFVCPLFFVNSATFFSFGCHSPGGCHPGRSTPCPLVMPLPR